MKWSDLNFAEYWSVVISSHLIRTGIFEEFQIIENWSRKGGYDNLTVFEDVLKIE